MADMADVSINVNDGRAGAPQRKPITKAEDPVLSPANVFSSMKGVLRLVQFVVSLIAFASMSSVYRYDADIYGDAWKMIIAIGVLGWINSLLLIVIYIIRPKIDQHLAYLPIYELAADGILTFLALIAGCLGATKCNQKFDTVSAVDPTAVVGSQALCSFMTDRGNAIAGVIFIWFTFIVYAASTVVSYMENKRQEQFIRENANVGRAG